MIEPGHDAPDLEDLAAYLDGRLSGDRKARVEERLLRDEDYYDVFMENVRSQQKQGESEGGEVVAPARGWRSPTVIAPAAVAATLIAALGLSLRHGTPIDEWGSALNAAVIVASGQGWDDPGWYRTRGLDFSGLTPEQLAFRTGTHLVGLRVALAGDDRDAARRASAALAGLTRERIDLLPVSGPYTDLSERADSDALAAITAEATELETYLAETLESSPEGGHFAVGRWNEVGRLAAAAGDAEALAGVFRQRDRRFVLWRRFPGHVLDDDRITPHLEAIDSVVESRHPSRDELGAAAAAFEGIARALAGTV